MKVQPFEYVIREHGATVFRVCRALVGPVEAEDAWSETFLAALKAYPQLPEGSNVEAWLVTIAHRKAIDQHRARQRVPTPMSEVPDRTTSARPEDDVVRRAGGEDLWLALDELPEKQRAAVAYHHVGGLPYADIARILGNSEAAARRAAADGIRKLRTRIGGGGQA